MQCQHQGVLKRLKRAEAKQHEDPVVKGHLQEELEEKKKYSLIVSQHVEEEEGHLLEPPGWRMQNGEPLSMWKSCNTSLCTVTNASLLPAAQGSLCRCNAIVT
ncbi:Golgin subfamily A member 4 [Fukomys damarensis]|uniref:Golgin subfamily A member 4 n=1 Tax=Fukomys damarensis TaxID=885580 RepID=A0A091D4C0_FUKDA|nr:Golgin subfamily A member 4 [Fukomys damarensis]